MEPRYLTRNEMMMLEEEQRKRFIEINDVGVGEILLVYDVNLNDFHRSEVLRREDFDGGIMYHVYIDKYISDLAVIVREDLQFTTSDWNTDQPENMDDFRENYQDVRWSDQYGHPAFMFNQLPVIFDWFW